MLSRNGEFRGKKNGESFDDSRTESTVRIVIDELLTTTPLFLPLDDDDERGAKIAPEETSAIMLALVKTNPRFTGHETPSSSTLMEQSEASIHFSISALGRDCVVTMFTFTVDIDTA